MSHRSSSNDSAILFGLVLLVVAIIVWNFVKSVAGVIGADPFATGKLMLVGLLASAAAGCLAYAGWISIRTAALATLSVVAISSHKVLISIANDGRAPDDISEMFGYVETWYTSWPVFFFLCGCVVAATIYSHWSGDR